MKFDFRIYYLLLNSFLAGLSVCPFVASCSFSLPTQSVVANSYPDGFVFPGRREGFCPGKTLQAGGRSWEGLRACVEGLAGEAFRFTEKRSCSFSCSLRGRTESWELCGAAKPLWGHVQQWCWGNIQQSGDFSLSTVWLHGDLQFSHVQVEQVTYPPGTQAASSVKCGDNGYHLAGLLLWRVNEMAPSTVPSMLSSTQGSW